MFRTSDWTQGLANSDSEGWNSSSPFSNNISLWTGVFKSCYNKDESEKTAWYMHAAWLSVCSSNEYKTNRLDHKLKQPQSSHCIIFVIVFFSFNVGTANSSSIKLSYYTWGILWIFYITVVDHLNLSSKMLINIADLRWKRYFFVWTDTTLSFVSFLTSSFEIPIYCGIKYVLKHTNKRVYTLCKYEGM